MLAWAILGTGRGAFETGFSDALLVELAKRDLTFILRNLLSNKRAADWCRELSVVPDIWLIFKIGYSQEPPKSYRRSVEEVLVD